MPRNSFLFRNCTQAELVGIPWNSGIRRCNRIDTCLTGHSIIQFRSEFRNRIKKIGENSEIGTWNDIEACRRKLKSKIVFLHNLSETLISFETTSVFRSVWLFLPRTNFFVIPVSCKWLDFFIIWTTYRKSEGATERRSSRQQKSKKQLLFSKTTPYYLWLLWIPKPFLVDS